MAEGRMLRKKVSRDGRVAQLSAHSALLYLMSIPHLDIDGRMDGSPVAVRGTVVPALASAQPAEWTDERVAACIAEWTRTLDEDTGLPRPLVLHYCTAGAWVCLFPGFAENQTLKRDRERPSSFPPPSSMLLEHTPDADSGGNPAEVRTQAEAEVQDQEPSDQRGLSRARGTDAAGLLDSDFSGKPVDDLASGILEGVARRRAALDTHGSLGRLLEVLPDADDRTPAVLHSVFDGLPPEAIEHARREILDVGPRRPSAYAVGIGHRLARGESR
jgi:hypothetical protein